ncbi:lipocalin family protein [Niveibacterium terrae]|uniref:lipocalin family protein n=1 Tax=Niveibacterium terrae TaxID=3373598 RepID=UPI003A8F698E
MNRLVFLALLALLPACTDEVRPEPGTGPALQPVAALDLPRYMGRWYEIAKFPNRFQKQCAADTRAEYQLAPDGQVTVTNSCRNQQGKIEQAQGVARQQGPDTSPRLQVRFAPAWLSLIPAVWGNYWVIDIDPDYQLVAVSEPSRNYLWILSRTPEVSETALAALTARLRHQGLAVEKLVRTRQASPPDKP